MKQQPANLFDYREGGIYQIICSENNKIYYGQTSCFLRRCFQHLSLLKKNKHSCLQLQEDFTHYGFNAFSFEIIQIENKISTRLKFEQELIKNTSLNLLYNPQLNSKNFRTKPRVAQQVEINDKSYPSIAEASRTLNKSSRTIRLKLDNSFNSNYKRIKYHRPNYFDEYSVIIEGQNFKSTRAVVLAGLATTTRQVRDRCRSLKWSKWILIKNRSNDYP